MTTRVNALTVILEKDLREDDVEVLKRAIKTFRGVLDCTSNVADLTSAIAESRARHDLSVKMWSTLFPNHKGE